MTFEQLFKILKKAELSPEQFGSYLGISGMTIRRWQDQEPQAEVPALYQVALQKTAEKLIMEGFLRVDDVEVQPFIKDRDMDYLKLNFQALGLDLAEIEQNAKDNKQVVEEALKKIGAHEKRQHQVEVQLTRIQKLSLQHAEMKKSIQTLVSVVSKKNIEQTAKFVAFGALFYLIAPMDLIPDGIPVFGFLDDIAILNLAAMYYAKKNSLKKSND